MLFSNAGAAGWGDLTVMSSLGQPLRAEIELVSASRQEDGPLTVKLAGFEAYRQANIEFNPVLMSLRFAVEQRGDRQFVRIMSTQPVNEPFVDMLLELNSGTGRVVREYVFLLDPAGTDGPQVATVAPVGEAAAPPARAAQTAKPAPQAAARSSSQAPRAVERQAPKKTAAAKPAAPADSSTRPRLTLSGVTAVSATDDKAGMIALEDYAAMEKQMAEANARVKALEQKVTELQKLLEVTNNLLAEMQKQNEAAKAGAKPAVAESAPAAPAAEVPVAASEPKPAEQPASAPAAPAAPKPVAPPPEEEADYLIPGAGLLVALLGAAGLYVRRRKAKKPFETGLYDDAPRDKKASAAGDAATAPAAGVLLQSGHAHEVDPLAEADVYIAYGRDVQAEDILKDALNKQPDRHPVRVKLLSIYAGRKDTQGFDALARELHRMTRGEGDNWAQAAELGREIDPGNPLYAVAPAKPAAPVTELVLERVPAEEAPRVTSEDDIPLPDLDSPGEPAREDIGADLDSLLASADAAPDVPALAGEVRESGPGPIDFKPAAPAAESGAAVPEVPALDLPATPAEDGNLMEFDFLKAEADAHAVPELPAAILAPAQEAPKEEVLLDFDFLKPEAAVEEKATGGPVKRRD